jgi:hypothetical protein
MPEALYLVNSRPTSPDKEVEYNAWYDDVHLADVCSVPGVVGAKRYRLAGDKATGEGAEYLAVYEIDADDPAGVVKEITNGVTKGRFALSDSIETDPPPITNLYIER